MRVSSSDPFRPYVFRISFMALSVISGSTKADKIRDQTAFSYKSEWSLLLAPSHCSLLHLKDKSHATCCKDSAFTDCGISPKAVWGRAGTRNSPCNCKTESNLIICFTFSNMLLYTYSVWLMYLQNQNFSLRISANTLCAHCCFLNNFQPSLSASTKCYFRTKLWHK